MAKTEKRKPDPEARARPAEEASSRVGAPDWFPAEIALLELPEKLSVHQWADRYRQLTIGEASRHGLYQSSWTPYAREPMDCLIDPSVEQITCVFGAQTGKTTLVLNMFAYMVDCDPGPMMLVMPTEADVHYMHNHRILPMIESSPQISRHLTGRADDISQDGISFDRCQLYYGNAQVSRSIKGRPVRFVALDEVDEMEDTKQGDPLSMAAQRTNTYPNRKIVKTSTPTWQKGKVWQSYLKSDQRRLWIPCPHCGKHQTLEWEHVRWEKDEDPEKACESAVYPCVECGQVITDAQRRDALADGVWVPAAATVDDWGKVTGGRVSRHRGYQLSSLYSPSLNLSEIVYRFLTEDYADFVRQILALPWEDTQDSVKKDDLERCIAPYERGTVPEGEKVTMVTAGLDVQGTKLGIFYVVRAWADNGESWLVASGNVRTWSGVEDGVVLPNWFGLGLTFAFVDSGDGTRQDEVYEFCRAYRGLVSPSKGVRSMDGPFKASTIDKHPGSGRVLVGGLQLWVVNTLMFKDLVAAAIAGSRAPWRLHSNAEGQLDHYLTHMRAEHKVSRNGQTYWTLKPGHVRNDWWDCETLAFAAMYRTVGWQAGRGGREQQQHGEPVAATAGEFGGHQEVTPGDLADEHRFRDDPRRRRRGWSIGGHDSLEGDSTW